MQSHCLDVLSALPYSGAINESYYMLYQNEGVRKLIAKSAGGYRYVLANAYIIDLLDITHVVLILMVIVKTMRCILDCFRYHRCDSQYAKYSDDRTEHSVSKRHIDPV